MTRDFRVIIEIYSAHLEASDEFCVLKLCVTVSVPLLPFLFSLVQDKRNQWLLTIMGPVVMKLLIQTLTSSRIQECRLVSADTFKLSQDCQVRMSDQFNFSWYLFSTECT